MQVQDISMVVPTGVWHRALKGISEQSFSLLKLVFLVSQLSYNHKTINVTGPKQEFHTRDTRHTTWKMFGKLLKKMMK